MPTRACKPCAKTPQPTMGVGQVAVVLFENQTFGYKGTTTWPDGSSCTFDMLTSFEKFFASQGPWAIVLEVLAAVLIIAVIVAVTIVTGSADLPALADGAAAVAEGVEAGADVAEAAAEAAEEVAEELADDLPNVQTFEGWPQNMGTMPSFPGGWQFVYPIPWVGGTDPVTGPPGSLRWLSGLGHLTARRCATCQPSMASGSRWSRW